MNQDQKMLIGITDEETGMHMTFNLSKKELDLMDDYCLEGMSMMKAFDKMRETYPNP